MNGSGGTLLTQPSNTTIFSFNGNSRVVSGSIANPGFFSAARWDGTVGSPTAVQAGDQLGGFNSWAYNGTALAGPYGTFRCYANQNQVVGSGGTYCDIGTTANGGTTLTEAIRFENDQGITVPSSVTGGDKGAGTINAGGLYVAGVAVVAGGCAKIGSPTSGAVLTDNGSGCPQDNTGTSTIGALTESGQYINSLNGALSTPPIYVDGTWITGGSGTTTKPQVLIEPTGTTSTAWSTFGTGLGINAPSAFGGYTIDIQVGGAERFHVSGGSGVAVTSFQAPTFTSGVTNGGITIESSNFTASGVAVNMATGTWTNSSGLATSVQIEPTYNQTSTAAATDLLINRTETAVGSGNQYFQDWQVGGSSKAHLDHLGNFSMVGLTASGSAIVLSGLGAATGTPNSICQNGTTITVNAALTCTVSNETIKNHFKPLQASLSDFMRLEPAEFQYNDVPGRTRWGFGAMQLASVNRALGDGWRADGKPWSIDENAILALTVKTGQEQERRIEALQHEVEQLKRGRK